MSTNVFAIKIKNRFFCEYKNNRINTAWSLYGAKFFSCDNSQYKKIEKILIEKKVKFEKAYIELKECEQPIQFSEIEPINDGKKREQLICRFLLSKVTDKSFIEHLCSIGYEKTGNKFQISFFGSKGYLSSFEIRCEGYQKEDNEISFHTIDKNVIINVFYSDENGVRLSKGNDIARSLAY